ncbi:MAG: hypothetical protein MJY68_00250 [Bacteroidaceae bacterium]|nr:hypothetical protein [Bacteroidaceae bacterium]
MSTLSLSNNLLSTLIQIMLNTADVHPTSYIEKLQRLSDFFNQPITVKILNDMGWNHGKQSPCLSTVWSKFILYDTYCLVTPDWTYAARFDVDAHRWYVDGNHVTNVGEFLQALSKFGRDNSALQDHIISVITNVINS